MEELFKNFFEAAKKRRKTFSLFKKAVVASQQYELAIKLREIEKEAWPEGEEQQEAKSIGQRVKLAMRMADMQVSESQAWLIAEIVKECNDKKGLFSIEDAVRLRLKQEELFGYEGE